MTTPNKREEEIFKIIENSGYENILIEGSSNMYKGMLQMYSSLKIDKPPTFAAKLCSRCRTVYYCDTVCQKTHWKKHKIMCKIMKTGDKINRICAYCKSIATTSIPCDNCEAYYCNTDCQKKDKNNHDIKSC